MKKMIESVKVWLRKQRTEREAAADERRRMRLQAEAQKEVQVMEFRGRLYVSVGGVPLFDYDALGASLTETVAKGRETYICWMEEKQWQNEATHVFTVS